MYFSVFLGEYFTTFVHPEWKSVNLTPSYNYHSQLIQKYSQILELTLQL